MVVSVLRDSRGRRPQSNAAKAVENGLRLSSRDGARRTKFRKDQQKRCVRQDRRPQVRRFFGSGGGAASGGLGRAGEPRRTPQARLLGQLPQPLRPARVRRDGAAVHGVRLCPRDLLLRLGAAPALRDRRHRALGATDGTRGASTRRRRRRRARGRALAAALRRGRPARGAAAPRDAAGSCVDVIRGDAVVAAVARGPSGGRGDRLGRAQGPRGGRAASRRRGGGGEPARSSWVAPDVPTLAADAPQPSPRRRPGRPRTLRVVAAASPRRVPDPPQPRRRREPSADAPRRGRGVAATRLRTLQIVAAASPRPIRGRSAS